MVGSSATAMLLCDGGPIWDWDLSWNSERPLLTYCFRRLLLTVIPCFVLWLTTALDITSRCHPADHPCGPHPWTSLTICKQAMTSLLIMCTASEGIYHLCAQTTGSDTRIEYLSVSAKLVTYFLALFLQIRQRRRGRLSSVKLTLFWTLMAVCECFASPLYNLITDELSEKSSEAEFVLGIVSLSLVVSEAFLSQFTDPQYNLIFADSKTDEYLTDHTSPLSSLFFSWLNRMMRYGYKHSLTADDLDALRPDIKTSHVSEQFLKNWSSQIAAKGRPSFCWALVRVMWPWMMSAVLLELIYDFASLVPPIVLEWLIKYMGDLEEPWWHGPVYALLLFGTAMLANLLMVHNLNLLIRASVVPRSGLKAAIYQKVFRLSLGARRSYSLGEICNLVTVDSQRVFELVWHINLVWSSPLRILLTLALLWRYLGVACLAGVAAMLALVPLTALMTVHMHRIQKKQMEWKDTRLRLLNEMLNGIKVLKLFAWEPPFMDRVRQVRELETKALKKLALLKGVVVFLWILAPFLVALCSFVTFVLLDEKNVLDPSIAFVSLTLFGRLKGAMSTIPEAINRIVQSRIASKRIVKFLLCEERDASEHRLPTLPGRVLELENSSFSWGQEDPFLRDLNFSLERGDLVAVVGRVGSGKSALLSAILGEMYRRAGDFRIQKNVRTAYVPQTAWIQNATLRQNVLFVSPMDKRKYDSVIRKCCLRPDLKMLPGGDHTEIGEKGVNLSGGQKQRVSLARAAYHEADLYLLDDPLSAVDAHVSKDIFADVVGPKGLLAQKTRILVTHDLSVLPKCDGVLMMSEGRIVESGRYRDLMAREDGLLRRLVEEFAHERATPEEEVSTPSPDPSSLTTEELIAQMRTIGRRLSRTMSVEGDHLQPSAAKLAKYIESERMEVGRVRAGVYGMYFRSAGLTLTALVIFGFAAHQAFEIGSNVWLSLWSVDPLLPDGSQDVQQRNLRMIVYGALGFSHGTCVLLGTVLLAIGSTRASIRLHRSMLYRVMRSPLAFFETTPLGRILNRFGKDIQAVDVEIPSSLSNLVTILIAVIGTLILICVNHTIFLLIMVPIALLYIFLQLFYIATSRQLRRLLSVTLSPVLSFFSESVQGAGTVRAFGCKDFFVRRQHALMDTNCKVFLRTSQVNRWLGVRLQLMGAVIVFIVAMLSVFQRVDYSAALVGLTLAYTLNVTELLGQMVMLFTQLETRMVSAERVDEYSTLEEEASWSTDLCHLSLSNWPSEGAIVFRGYRMSYKSGSESVLKGIDLEIPGGQKVGVVGRTGAGKSSLAQALFRVVEPSSGYLFIDGVDVAALGLHDLRSRITVIPQDPVLFGGDLRLNLDPQNRHTDREVLSALEMARLELTDEGLDRKIEEGGENLSVGQRQQVCLARALLQRSRILVLDEATAAVDLQTDRFIQETIREEFRNCTIITVAHRLHTVLDYDRILVMEQGRIAEDGPPAALLKRTNSLFRELARSAGLL